MTDYEIVDVTKLQKAEGVKDGDTLLLIRQQGDGTSICMRTDGAQFKGTDAYDVAKANGFSGTREEWAQQVARINEVSAAIDNANDTASHPTKIGSDNYVYEWNKATKAYQKTGILVKGDKGERGATGAQGEQGPQGAKGETGARGAQGATGPQGAQGAKGDRGENGKSPIIKNASWWIWDEASGAYKDSGMSVSSQYTLTKEAIEGVLTGDVSSHTHSAYAAKTHTHTEYAAVGHTHTEYAAVDHTHSNYALTTHKHTEYAAVSHTHDNYALTGHKHTEYALATALGDYYTKAEVDELIKAAGVNNKETINITLTGGSLDGAVVTVRADNMTVGTYTWQGSTISCKVDGGRTVTVIVSDVEGYTTPAAQSFESVAQNVRDITFAYTVKAQYPIGVYILDTDNNLTKAGEWNTKNNNEAVGVYVGDENHRFVIAPRNVNNGNYVQLSTVTLNNLTSLPSKNVDAAKLDFDGLKNTDAIIGLEKDYRGAPSLCKNTIFKNGKTGYLPALGELYVCWGYLPEVNEALRLIGGSDFDSRENYWSSTYNTANFFWTKISNALAGKTYDSYFYARPFCSYE